MKFNHKVTEAIWNEEQGKCKLRIAKIYIDESIDEFEDECVGLPNGSETFLV
jgi:hydroxyversicolorone monooxygenase